MTIAGFPRTLFITPAAFNHVTGGGITFSTLFRGWPGDRLATMHSDTVPTVDDVCRRYYRLGHDELARWPRFLAAAPDTPGPPAAAPPAGRPAIGRRAKRWIAGNGWPDCGRLIPRLESWIAAFEPELVYTILGTIGMMELVDAVRRRFALPLVVHFMDDWPSHLYRGGMLSFAARARMQALVRRLVDVAAERMAIGDAMAEAYAQRYGVPFSAFQNAVDMDAIDSWAGTGRAGKGTASGLHVVYAGALFDNAQAQSVIDVARAVAALSARGLDIRFDLYSPSHLAERFRPLIETAPCVRLHDAIEDDARFFGTIAAADILVLPVNFDADSVRLVRYSMPTKLPAYLASGTPVLVYGPPGLAQVEDARRHGWGHVVDRRGVDEVSAALAKLSGDPDLRRTLAARARTLAVERHDAAKVRRAFQSRLAAAAGDSAGRTAAHHAAEREAAMTRGAG
ncbi:MAG: hypothetical protein GEU76_16255 [Alphaproteobacteria bacterium]|nr:hypothetical protein [Alphaproteobacteria bacterium]